MDNIEQLLRDADPRASRDSGGPLPLDLSDPAPVFIQRPVAEPPKEPRHWLPVALGAMATAAAVAAVVVWAPWNAPAPDPLPATPPTHTTTVPEPSESGAADPTGTPAPAAWPNGLFPAWAGAHFADDAACHALAVPQIKVQDAGGKLSNPGYDAKAFALIGCLEGYAAFTPTDRFRVEQNIDDTSGGMLLAKWNPESKQWVSSPSQIGDDGVEVQPEYLSWPLLRGYTYEPDETPAERMDRAIKHLGIDAKLAETLLGPNVPSWMAADSGDAPVTFSNSVLELTHPAWTKHESMRAAGGKVLDPATTDPKDAATYQLMFFDAHGKAVFNLGLFPDDRSGDAADNTCNDPSATYALHGLAPTSVVADEGKLALGLVTETDVFGIERSTVSLVPAGSPAQGKMCDLPTAFHLDGRMLQSDAWTGYLGFKDAAERNAYLEATEYQRAREVAASLRLR
jgi:hypothetical protein